MLLNGKEIKFYYSVWAHCELMDWIVEHKEASIPRGVMQKALIMNEAAIKAGLGGERLSPEDFEDLPGSAFVEIKAEIDRQEQEDCKISVETKKTGKKTVKS
jgi:hypothetical protein